MQKYVTWPKKIAKHLEQNPLGDRDWMDIPLQPEKPIRIVCDKEFNVISCNPCKNDK